MQIRRHTNGTGGGPSTRLSLSDLEERVLGVIGQAAVDGQAGIEEQGFGVSSHMYLLGTKAYTASDYGGDHGSMDKFW